ncbi:MAG: putative alkylmercury lyase [Dehalococcoidia bacterium]|nr:putative alkylmercury lyase [Dehalococcoidia bacterium]
MKIELLYFDSCPNWRRTLNDITAVLKEHRMPPEVSLVKVTSAEEAVRLAFPGSPTVRVDGVDVEPDAPTTGFGLACRIYSVEDMNVGWPPKEWIAAALDATLG